MQIMFSVLLQSIYQTFKYSKVNISSLYLFLVSAL